MNDIDYKIQMLIELHDFESLSPAEKEMVYSVMSEADYVSRREVLLQSEKLFEQESLSIIPDPNILGSLKQCMAKDEDALEEERVRPFTWLNYKVSFFKSAVAALLLLLGSYFLFSNTEPSIQYIEKEIVVMKKVRDTIFLDKIIEVPVEKLVTKVEYVTIPIKQPKLKLNSTFAIKEMSIETHPKPVSLQEINKSYGNSKIDEKELDQFRVCL